MTHDAFSFAITATRDFIGVTEGGRGFSRQLKTSITSMSEFEKVFLENCLKFELGSMPKSDTDALVMHLLDTYGSNGSEPLATLSNQAISERLKAPVSKIKKLRYDATLKFGGRIEDPGNEAFIGCIEQGKFGARW